MTGQAAYAFDNAHELQRERLQALEAALDAGTIRVLHGCGIEPGWRCLEVGAGGGSIADWMCEQVGPEGGVLATDLDTTVLQARSRPNLDIRVHDVLADDLPSAAFDLVHVRLLLAWLPEPRAALERVRRALKPGGWLVAEELDFVVAYAEILTCRYGERATLRLPSGETRLVPVDCRATVGTIGNADHQNIVIGKAGRSRHLGKRPQTRGTAMNPVDHPHGGGEGRTSGGRHPVTPWGKPTKGARTRHNKATDKMIIRSRHAKKKR